jgi:uncharacterized protein YndB with AHSA1/START domain
MALTFHLSTLIVATPETIYKAWLNSEQHSQMIGGAPAKQSHIVGAEHSAFGSYITGKNLELIPNTKIVQSWRNEEFLPNDPDSILEVKFEQQGDKTLLSLTHSEVPEKEKAVEAGWVEYYFKPMKTYFER